MVPSRFQITQDGNSVGVPFLSKRQMANIMLENIRRFRYRMNPDVSASGHPMSPFFFFLQVTLKRFMVEFLPSPKYTDQSNHKSQILKKKKNLLTVGFHEISS